MKISILVNLAALLVVAACLFGIRYSAMTTGRIQILEVNQADDHGLMIVARRIPGSGDVFLAESLVTRIDGAETGISCIVAGKVLEIVNKNKDSIEYVGIYIKGLEQREMLRQLAAKSRYENLEMTGKKERLIYKFTEQLIWKRKSH